MLNSKQAEEIILDTVHTSISKFAERSLSKKAKFQILDLIIPKERKIRSIVGGLETSLGTTLWEPLAKALASENGFQVIDSNLQCPVNIPAALSNTLNSIIDDRKKSGGLYDALSSHDEIRRVCQTFIARPIETFEDAPKGKGVDIWLVKDNTNYFFDTKTVQPNLNTLSSCMEQVLNWYAYFYSKTPTGNAVSRIVFPYNPKPEKCFWDVVIGKGKPLERDNEAWVEGEFWDFCSGVEGTYQIIAGAFTKLSESGALEESLNKLLNNHE